MAKGEAVDVTPFDPTSVPGNTKQKAASRKRAPRASRKIADETPPKLDD